MGKRVLILGNGFDLAHGLPTRYSNFLNFCEKAIQIYNFDRRGTIKEYSEKYLNDWDIDEHIKYILSEAFINRKQYHKEVITSNEKLDKLYTYIKENTWYNCLQKIYTNKKIKGENWIDFESEISSFIQLLDKKTENLLYEFEIPQYSSEDVLYKDDRLMWFLTKYTKIKKPEPLEPEDSKKHIIKVKMKELRTELHEDLKKLIQALEIYLRFVESIIVNVKSQDITTNHRVEKWHDINYNVILKHYNFDYVINFNYTHTYKNVYGISDEIFYIHGETNHEPNNMVLGIDEYWSEEERDSHTNFTIFKKFAQRIQKKTGIDSYEWIKEINDVYEKNIEKNSRLNGAVAEVHIFGHSLDVTDKDILKDYLESEATDVTIYCKDEETEGEYIANVIKIIGEKRLLEKVNQYPPKLRFVIQQDMASIEKEEKELLTLGAAT